MSAQPIKQVHSVRFTLPMCPPSVNSLYVIHYKAANPSDRVKLRPECQRWKSDAKVYIPRFPVADDSIVRIDWTVYYPWLSKNKAWAKRDTSNMMKLLFDMISEKIGVDDRRFKEGMMRSVNAPGERTEVVLVEVPIATWSTYA